MKIEDWDESFLDLADYQVERATNAALAAIHRASRFSPDFVIEEEGLAKSLKPHQTARRYN